MIAGHDMSKSLPLSVKAVVIDRGRVLLLLNARGEWELPGGRPGPGEDLRTALVREVLEESGLAVEAGAALDEQLFEVLPGSFVRLLPFACRVIEGEQVIVSHEHLEARWLPIGDLGDCVAGHRLPAVYRAVIAAATEG
jgi:8-oxo-dGTP diphosphatase